MEQSRRQFSPDLPFWGGLVLLVLLVSVIGSALRPVFFPKVSILTGFVFVISGLAQKGMDRIVRRKCGVLAKCLLEMSVRTGIPLLATLAFFLCFDKILSKYCVLTLALYYLLLFPVEVWSSLMRRKMLEEESGQNDAERQTGLHKDTK